MTRGNESGERILERAVVYARGLMKGLHGSHGWSHVERVITMAQHIAAVEGNADHFIVTAAAILHDIARDEEDRSGGAVCHAKRGSELAFEFLIAEGLDEGRAAQVAACIRTHRFRDNEQPASIEARVVYDADKLDSIGAVGIGRAFVFSGEIGAQVHNAETDIGATRAYSEEDTAYREYVVKLSKVRDRMLTVTGRRIAGERHRFMEEFFTRFLDEMKGER